MRLRIGIVAACLFLLPFSVAADTMELRTGEHSDFTRVVLAFDVLPSWQAGRTASGYAVKLDGSEPLLTDLSRAFALIGRDRVGDIKVDAEERRVDIELSCDCHAEFFELNNVRLVIDVRDGPQGPNATHELPIDLNTAPRARSAIQMPVLPALAAPNVEPRRSILGGRGDTRIVRPSLPPALSSVSSRSGVSGRTGDAVVPLNQLSTEARSTFQDVLPSFDRLPTISSTAVEAVTEQLGRAASQGLVEVETRPDRVDPPANGDVIPGPQNFRVFTGFDRDTNRIDQSITSTAQGMRCIPDEYVNVLEWGDPDRAEKLGEFRQWIVKDTGAIDADAMRDLARYYVVLGFGAEARFAAQQLPDSEERDVLIALAEIVDNGSSNSPLFVGQIACPGKVAMWAAVAKPFTRGELPISTDGILRTFSALPPHLREHLGPVLSQRLRTAGETALARAALSAVTRTGSGTVGQELTAARLELLGTRAAQARSELERISKGTNVAAAEALIELLQDAARRRVPPKPEWVDDADALIRVTEGTDVAEQLSVSALKGHIPLGRFDELRRALSEERPGLNSIVKQDIAADALSAAVVDADDETFLRAELGFSDFASPGDLDATRRFELVDRFLELGLPELAAKYLPDEMLSAEEITLAARTYAALDRRAYALTLVGQSEDESLASVRAEILAQVRNFEGAAKAFEALGQTRASEIQALRSGDWNWIANQATPELSDAAQAAITEPLQGPVGSGMNAALINSVSARHAAYLELLDRTEPLISR